MILLNGTASTFWSDNKDSLNSCFCFSLISFRFSDFSLSINIPIILMKAQSDFIHPMQKPKSMARTTSKQALITSLHISPGNCLKNCWTCPAQPHYSNYLQERTYKSVITSHKSKMGMIKYLSMLSLFT